MPERIYQEAQSLQAALTEANSQASTDKQHLEQQKSAFLALHSQFTDGLQSHFEEVNRAMTDKIDQQIAQRDLVLGATSAIVEKAEADCILRLQLAKEQL